ncbi:hypothetical protein LTR95_001722 [Oleoguttula sp. CCFEE 5521]
MSTLKHPVLLGGRARVNAAVKGKGSHHDTEALQVEPALQSSSVVSGEEFVIESPDAHAPLRDVSSADSAVQWFDPFVLSVQSRASNPHLVTASLLTITSPWFNGEVSLPIGERRLAASVRALDEECKHIFAIPNWSAHSGHLINSTIFEAFDSGAEGFEGTLPQVMEAIAPYLKQCDTITIPCPVVYLNVTSNSEVIKSVFTPADFTKRIREACAIRETLLDTCEDHDCEADTYQIDASIHRVLHVVGQCAKVAHGIIEEDRKFDLIMDITDLGDITALLFRHMYSSEDAAVKHEFYRHMRAAIAAVRGHDHLFRIRRIDWQKLKLEHVFLMEDEAHEWVEGGEYVRLHTGSSGDEALCFD